MPWFSGPVLRWSCPRRSLPSAVRAAEPAPPREFSGATPLQWSLRMADSEIARRDGSLIHQEGGSAKWDYTVGLFTLSLVRLGEQVNEPRYWKYADSVIGSFITPDGRILGYRLEDYSLDNLNSGKTVLALYRLTQAARYKQAALLLRRQLDTQPRTSEGGFWHKLRYPHQMWLDGVYMEAPFYAECARVFQEPASSLDDVAKQFRLVAAHTYDPATGLFYHGWDESKEQAWANKTTGTSPNFWSRAIGWYAMALVDALDYFPADHPARPELIALLQKVCAGVVRYQDPGSGLWYQVTDQGDRKGNYLEATGSSMFVYALAKGINHGYLSRDYLPAVLKGYAGLVGRLVKVDATGPGLPDACCAVAGLGYGRDGTFDYYVGEPVVDNDLKGVGPFILAGIELQQLLGLPMVATPASRGGVRRGARARRAPEWAEVPGILARIVAPVFPDRDFPITDFGAVADGKTDCTAAIEKAIAACHQAGGGHVTVDAAGVFLTGPIHLLSNVDLLVAGGSTLRFLTDPARYLPAVFTRWEGVECYNYSPLIYAFEQENIAVTGDGTLDGAASEANWWAWTQRGPGRAAPAMADARALNELGDQGVPVAQRVFGGGHFLRPNFIQPYRCRNVLIEGVHIRRSPMWEVNPELCTNVIVRGVDIVSTGPNNDGCDPESCRDVLIERCQFTTGDDCIAIKSGRNNDGRRVGTPSENIIVRQCTMKDGHGGVVIGSEVSGNCRNVFVEDCRHGQPPPRPRAAPQIQRPPRRRDRERFMRRVDIGQVAEAVMTIDFVYEEGAQGPYHPRGAQRRAGGRHEPRQPAGHVDRGLCRGGDRRHAVLSTAPSPACTPLKCCNMPARLIQSCHHRAGQAGAELNSRSSP